MMGASQLRRGSTLLPIALAGAVLLIESTGGVAEQVATLARLGVFPGMALVAWLPRVGRMTRLAAGLILSPLIGTLLGWALLRLSIPMPYVTSIVMAIAVVVWTWGEARGTRSDADESLCAPFNGKVLLWGGLWSLAIVIAAAVNPHLPYRSDAWYHGGIIIEIMDRGLPPEDPRFAGLHANYMWFYHLFIAFLSSARNADPFVFMTIFNVIQAAACAWAGYVLGWSIWRRTRAAIACMGIVTLGFSAGAWLLWPLRGVQGLIGETRGWSHVAQAYGPFEVSTWHVVNTLTPPFAHMVSYVDKFLVGTALSHAWVLTLLYLCTSMAYVARPRRSTFVLISLCALGIMLFHGVVAGAVMTAGLLATLLALLWRRGPQNSTRSQMLGLGSATLAGCAAGAPYLLSVTRGWASDRSGLEHQLFHLSLEQMVTLMTACGVAGVLAWPTVRRTLSSRETRFAWLTLYAAVMLLIAVTVNLPDDNESKFAFLLFIPLAALAAERLGTWAAGLAQQTSGRMALTILAFAVLFNPVITVYGFAVDPAGRSAPEMHPTPDESRLHEWILASTPSDAVLLDSDYRDILMVLARRQVYLGTPRGPEKAAYPLDQVKERREVMADLFEKGQHLDLSAQRLRSLNRPTFIVFRPDGQGVSEGALEARPDLFARVRREDGFSVYRLE